LSVSYVRGTHTPRMAHSAGWGRRISFVWASTQGRQPVSFVNKSTYLFGVNGRVNENKSINQSHLSTPLSSALSFPPFSLATSYHRGKHFYFNPKASPLPEGRRPLDSGGWLLRRDRKRLPPTTHVPRPLFPRLRRLRSGFGPPPLLRPSLLPAGTARRPSNGSCSVPDGPGYSS
jgi:hypothetical protein